MSFVLKMEAVRKHAPPVDYQKQRSLSRLQALKISKTINRIIITAINTIIDGMKENNVFAKTTPKSRPMPNVNKAPIIASTILKQQVLMQQSLSFIKFP